MRMKKTHYGWVVCVLGMLMIFVTTGMVSNGFSVFLPYIRELRGFTNTQTSFLINVRYMVAFASMLSIGLYYKLMGMRLGTGLAVIFAGGAYLRCRSLWEGAQAEEGGTIGMKLSVRSFWEISYSQ